MPSARSRRRVLGKAEILDISYCLYSSSFQHHFPILSPMQACRNSTPRSSCRQTSCVGRFRSSGGNCSVLTSRPVRRLRMRTSSRRPFFCETATRSRAETSKTSCGSSCTIGKRSSGLECLEDAADCIRVSWRESPKLVDKRSCVPLLEGTERTPVMVCWQLKREEEPRARVSQRRAVLPLLAATVVGVSHERDRELPAPGSVSRISPSIDMWITRSEPAIAAVSPAEDMALSHNVVSSLPIRNV